MADFPRGGDEPALDETATDEKTTDAAVTDAVEADAVEADAVEADAVEEIQYDADPVLLASVDQARAALEEITSPASIGEVSGSIVHGEHVLSILFESRLSGYPDWNWTVTLSRVDESSEPAVLETELMPSEGSLVAPDWIPWSERLADYRLAQEHATALAAAEADDSDDDDDDSDEDDSDEDELDDDLDDTDDGLDLDDHIDDDSELEHHFDDSDHEDAEEDDAAEAPAREHVAGRRRRSSRLDASVVVDKANESPERSTPRHLLDPHDEGFEIVTLDESEPRSSVYYDEEADQQEH